MKMEKNADCLYPSEPWLLTSILRIADGSQEALYTARYIKARIFVERCIGMLKGRFRCILKHLTEYDAVKAGKIINACAMLHNTCILAHMPANVEDLKDSETDDHLVTSAFTASAELVRAIQIRSNVYLAHGQ